MVGGRGYRIIVGRMNDGKQSLQFLRRCLAESVNISGPTVGHGVNIAVEKRYPLWRLACLLIKLKSKNLASFVPIFSAELVPPVNISFETPRNYSEVAKRQSVWSFEPWVRA